MKDLLRTLLFKYWKYILGILYVIIPIDVIPDVLIPLGYTDDLLVILALAGAYYGRKVAKEKGINFHGTKKQKSNSDDEIIDGELVEE